MSAGRRGENPPKEDLSLGARKRGSSSAKSGLRVGGVTVPICSTEVDVGVGKTVYGGNYGVQGDRDGKVVGVEVGQWGPDSV
jgi:hypothetical protein